MAKRVTSGLWRHFCKVLRAISYRWDEECPYCGRTPRQGGDQGEDSP